MMLMESPRSRREQELVFHSAVVEAYERHGFKSLRQAERITGINYSTIHAMISRVHIPSRGQVIEWAEGLKEDINHWLRLAGYDPIEIELIDEDSPELRPAVEKIINVRNKSGSLDRKALAEEMRGLADKVDRGEI